jgi:chromosome segregation ATPase
LRAENALLRREAADFRDAASEWKLKARTAEAQVEDLRQECAKAKSDSDFSGRKAAIEMRAIADQLAAARADADRLREGPPSLAAELSQSRRNNNALVSRVRELRNRIRALEDVKAAGDESELREENELLKSSVRRLAREDAELDAETERTRMLIDAIDAEDSMQDGPAADEMESSTSEIFDILASVRQLHDSADVAPDDGISQQLQRLSQQLERFDGEKPAPT